ncbi:DUF4129 domain-containing protein [Chitinophaga sp. SYP-B3965]|uniref:DUF4129 domain-containing protein n=1 Tax=Chitinophaga sp. SYP-B3965 TaxID=2663120 RepID=UPI001299BB9D|nr:DUF4129 domain-containing protein [Chitinophaga sp. SYP-B3965]MRG46718.1 DUF4129 domain-containing protein [Chitinophaga sp. SYP-B3965]
MRRVIYIALLLLLCTGVRAQDSTTTTDEEEYTAVVDTTVATESDKELTLEDKLREKQLPHSLWDDQRSGEWNDAAQGRLAREEIPAEKMEELRSMKALQYEEKPRDEKSTLNAIGAWVGQHLKFFRLLFYILLGLLLLMGIVLFIRKNDIPLFRRSHQRTEEGEILTAEGPQNYDALARAAIAAGNWREAVRMRYLHSLQLLEAKQLIAPGKDKTNMDYLRELASTAWYKPFATLTLHYEYIWYGQQPLNNGQFSQLEEQFSAFKTSLR